MSGMFEAGAPRQERVPERSGRVLGTLVITASRPDRPVLGAERVRVVLDRAPVVRLGGLHRCVQTLLWTRIGLFLVFGGVMAAVVALNLVLAYRARPSAITGGDANLARYREAVAPISGWLLGGVSVLMGLFAGASATGQWREFSLWRHASSFGSTDPYFDRDLGFYVFQLPWWHYLTDFVMALAVIGLMAAAVVHYLYGGIRLSVPA